MSDISLKEYIEEIIDLKFSALDRQIAMTSIELDRRLQGMNEVREQLAAQKAMFLQKDIYNVEHGKLRDDVFELKKVESKMKGYVLGAIGAATLIFGVLDFAIRSYILAR